MLKRFILIVCGSFVGAFLALVVFFISAIMLSMALMKMGSSQKVADNSVLHLCLEGAMDERQGNEEVNVMGLVTGNNFEYMYLDETIKAIKAAKEDDRIQGIYIECKDIDASAATLRQVRQAIIDFKKSGKFVYAYANEGYSQGDYYVATVADSILLNPIGALDVHGLAAVTPYYKKLLDKVGVEMQVVRVGTYKSAVEPYMIDSISPANREQQELYLNNIWGTMASEMAAARGISVDAFNSLADSITIAMETSKLVKSHLIDRTCYKHEMESRLKQLCGLDPDDDLRLVSIPVMASYYKPAKSKDGSIAVVYASGEIDGGGGGGIDSEELVATLEDIMKDDDIKGVVLRVNSPGGSAFGSEQIWEALERVKKTGRPLAVSMGDLAASGGYYISCGADHIFADSVTITGSIGVFGVIPTGQELYQNKLGINVSVVKTNANSEMSAMGIYNKKFTPVQLAALQNYVNQTYDLFTKRCADGRHMPQDSIKKIAEGRVWDAKSAKKLKLIDDFGSLDDAIKWVAAKAKLQEGRYGVIEAPEVTMNWKSMLGSIVSTKYRQQMAQEMGDFYKYFEQLKSILNRHHVLCLMEYTEIR